MSSEHVRLFAKDKTELSKHDIISINKKIRDTMDPSATSTRGLILAKRDVLSKYAEKMHAIQTAESKIRSDVHDYKTKLSVILENSRTVNHEFTENKKALEAEKQRLLVLQNIREFANLDAKIRDNLSSFTYTIIEEQVLRMEHIAQVLHFEKRMQTCLAKYKQIVEDSYIEILEIEDTSFDLTVLGDLKHALRALNMSEEFMNYFFGFLMSRFLTTMESSAVSFDTRNNKIVMKKLEGSNDALAFIDHAISVLRFVVKCFDANALEVPEELLKSFQECVFSTGLKLTGGKPSDLEDLANKMCVITHSRIDVNVAIRNARMPVVLGSCRSLLEQGRPLGEVLSHMKSGMGTGVNCDGILKMIVVMATVIWKQDKTRLEAAVPTLIALGTREAFESALILDEACRTI